MVNTAPFGVIISFVSTFSNSMGMVLQKVGYNKRDKAFLEHMRSINKTDWKEEDKPTIFKNWIWWLGIILMACASLFDFASYALAPASLLAPLASMTLVWNTLLSWKILGEYIGWKDIFSIMIIMVGAILAVVFGDKTAADYNLDGLIELYNETSTQAYLGVLGSIIVISMISIKAMSVMIKLDKYACCCNKKSVLMIHPLLYGLVGGLFGGLTSILTKSVGEILSNLFQGDPDGFKHWESYLLIVGMICSLLLQIRHLNGGLAVYDAMIIVPVYQTFWILASILSGSIYFQEINNFNDTQWVMFPIAIVITLLGLWVLSACKSKPDKNKAKAEDDVPTALNNERKMSLADAGETIEMGIRVNDTPEVVDDNNSSKLHINASDSDTNYKPPPQIVTQLSNTHSEKKSSPRKKSLASKSPTKPNSVLNKENKLTKTPESLKPMNSEGGEVFETPISIDIPSPDKI